MRIKVTFSEGQRFTPQFTDTDQQIVFKFGEFYEITVGGDWWDGAYEITPRTTEQVLPVKNKTMRHDLTCNSIPYTEVSNPSGGYTANIGG